MVERPEYQSRPEIRSLQSFPSFSAVGEKPKGPLEKFLSYFADVRAGEGMGVVLLTLNVFLLLSSYYLLKTVREALILTEGGAYVKAYSAGAQAAVLMLFVPIYGYIGTKVVRIWLLTGLSLFFFANLLVFSFVGRAGVPVGVTFYVWLGIYNMFVISQFWAFATDLYTEPQGKRLFPMIGVGSSLGAWLGAEAASQLVGALKLSPYDLMLMAAVVLLFCAALLWVVNRIETGRASREMATHAEKKLDAADGFALIFQNKYLLLIAAMVVALNITNSLGEFLLGDVVSREADLIAGGDRAVKQRFVGEFYGRFFSIVNLLGFLLQTFAVSRIIQFLGVRGALFIMPCVSLVSYSVLAIAPVLGVVRVAKILDNSTDYSIQNTVRQALFLPTSREAKYKAKAAIDTFFVRCGDLIQAGLVRLGASLAWSPAVFAWITVGLVIGTFWLATRLANQHRRMGF